MSRLLNKALPLVLLSVAVISFEGQALAGNEAQVYAQAQQDFQARRFSEALSKFQTVARTRPTDATCHYYMALCYQNLNQISLANLEYQWVSSNSRDPKLRSQSLVGMNQLTHYKPTRAATPTSTNVASSSVAVASASAPKGDFSRGKIKVIEFNTKWCHVCKFYNPIFEQVEHSGKYNSSCEFDQLDAEESQNQTLVQKYSVTGFPTTIMADSSGKQIKRFSGGTSAAGLCSMIDSALQMVPR